MYLILWRFIYLDMHIIIYTVLINYCINQLYILDVLDVDIVDDVDIVVDGAIVVEGRYNSGHLIAHARFVIYTSDE